jgi:phage-related protein
MAVSLVEIPGFLPEWEVVYRVRALKVNDRALALKALRDLQAHHPEDYAKLMATMTVVARHERVRDPWLVRKDAKGGEVYEMKGGHARLFYFYAPDDSIVVCTHHYWKAKPSQREQDAQFRKCARLREMYLAYAPQKPGSSRNGV